MLLNNQKSADTEVVIDRAAHAIVLSRTLPAPRERVFEAWTQAEQVTCWWDPSGEPLKHCEIDLRPGGAFRFASQHAPDDQPFAGIYREVLSPDILVFEAMGAIGRVLFKDTAGGTHLTVRIECGSADNLEQFLKIGIADGTAKTLDNLADYIAACPL